MVFPFHDRKIGSDQSFTSQLEEKLIHEHNIRVKNRKNGSDLELLYRHPNTQKLLPPLCWSGNPFEATVLLLLKNPSWDIKTLDLVTEPDHFERFEKTAHCTFGSDEYHNPHLHPNYRNKDTWHADLFRDLHADIKEKLQWQDEKVWLFLSQHVCMMEVVPWRSRRWSDDMITSDIHVNFCGPFVREAMEDPHRMAIMGRGEKQWRMVASSKVSQLPKIKNVQKMSLNRTNMQEHDYEEMLRLLLSAVPVWVRNQDCMGMLTSIAQRKIV